MATVDEIRRLIGQNSAFLLRANQQEERIRQAAAEELRRVNARIEELKPGMVNLSPALANEYRELIVQRARLAYLNTHSGHHLLTGN